jgi:murein DD-endopeptidase MepM/ murein hydrolase activator NlpD
MRWLGGTILTGLTSVFLMGGALMAALDSPNHFAGPPDASGTDLAEIDGVNGFGQKSDRMRPIEEEIATRQILQVSTVTRHGERDFIKLRPFARITATLGTANDEDRQVDIPEYDVLRIFADSSTPDPGSAGTGDDGTLSDTNVDGEVSVKVSELPVGTPVMSTVALDSAAVEQIVRAAAKFGGGGDLKMATAMAYANDADYGGDVGMVEGEDPFSALGVKIVPENVSSVAKSDVEAIAGQTFQEKLVTLTGNEELLTVLEKNNMTEDDATEVVTALAELMDLSKLDSENKIRVAYIPDEDDAAAESAIRVSVYENGVHQATVARSDADTFVRADEPNPLPESTAETETVNRTAALPKLYDAVYRTALEQQVPGPLVDQLIRIFAFDVDFQARITPGDSVEIFHSIQDPDDREAPEPEILYAALNVGGVAKRFYRFRTSDDGYVDYYDEEGRSAKKFLMRKPVSAGVLRSRFGMRFHPILKGRRMHTGVDYSAPRGTPILAAGNGRVEKAGRTSGYGNVVIVHHTNGYETVYAHQSKFAKGISPGARVRQGQIIGYVGSTGLSTGPHLHFEIRVNGSAVDPLRIRLPRGRVLDGEVLEAFQNERNRIDTLLGNPAAPTTVASRE